MLNLFQVADICDNLEPIVYFIKKGVIPIIQIGIPIILIVMGSIDLGKAVISQDDKEIKGATGKLIKRCIAAVAVFFVVTIVTLVMGLFAGSTIEDGTNTWSDCWQMVD